MSIRLLFNDNSSDKCEDDNDSFTFESTFWQCICCICVAFLLPISPKWIRFRIKMAQRICIAWKDNNGKNYNLWKWVVSLALNGYRLFLLFFPHKSKMFAHIVDPVDWTRYKRMNMCAQTGSCCLNQIKQVQRNDYFKTVVDFIASEMNVGP